MYKHTVLKLWKADIKKTFIETKEKYHQNRAHFSAAAVKAKRQSNNSIRVQYINNC